MDSWRFKDRTLGGWGVGARADLVLLPPTVCKVGSDTPGSKSQDSAGGFGEARSRWKEKWALNPCLPAKVKTVQICL